jgi:hypothetical protein
MPPWLCLVCGYDMNAVAGSTGPSRAPEKGDIGLCANCGAAYVMQAEWVPMTADVWDDLSTDLRAHILGLQGRAREKPDWTHRRAGHA